MATILDQILGLVGKGANFMVPTTTKRYKDAWKLFSDKSISDEEKKKLYQDVMSTGGKSALELGSFLVPFGKGANVLSKAILPGMAVGGMRAASEEKVTPQSVAQGVGIGGVLGGAGELLSKALGGASSRIMNTVLKEPLKRTRAAVKTGKTLGETALKKGFKGLTDEGIYNKSIQTINSLEDALQTALKSSKRIIPMAEIKKSVQPLITKYSKAGNLSAVNNITNRLESLEKFHGKSIPASVANEVKRTLYDEARSAYGQIASESMEGIKAIARGFKEQIGSKIKGADAINKDLSYYGRIADSLLDKLAKGGRYNVVGLSDAILGTGGYVGGGPVGAVGAVALKKILGSTPSKIMTARGLDTASKVPAQAGMQTVLSLINAAKSGVGEQSYQPSGDQYQNQQPVHDETISQTEGASQEILSPKGQWKWDPQANDWVPNQAAQQTGGLDKDKLAQLLPMLMLQDLEQTGGKNISELKTIFDVLGATGGEKTSAVVKKRQTILEQAAPVLARISSSALKAPAGMKGAGLALLGKIPGIEGGEAEYLSRDADAFARLIASAFASEVGVATDKDVARWKGMMPQPGDTVTERRRQVTKMVEQIQNEAKTLNMDVPPTIIEIINMLAQ